MSKLDRDALAMPSAVWLSLPPYKMVDFLVVMSWQYCGNFCIRKNILLNAHSMIVDVLPCLIQ